MLTIVLSITASGLFNGGEAKVIRGIRVHDLTSDNAKAKVIRATSPVEDRNLFTAVEDTGGETYPFTPLWGADVLIRSDNNGSPGGLAMDVADNGDVYVGVLMNGPGNDDDTLEIWRSTDGGYTWSKLDYLKVVGEIDHSGIDIAVGPGSNPWLYVAVNWDALSSYTGQGIYFRRMRVDGSAYNWVSIVEEDTVGRPRISVNNDDVLAITYITDNNKVYRGVSSDNGTTWNVAFANYNTTWAEIYVSDNGRGYHAYVMRDTNVVVVTFNAPSPSADNVNVLSIPDTARHVSITASGGAVASQEAMVVWANRHPATDVWDVHYSTSSDGGTTWNTPTVFPPTNFPYTSGKRMNYPYAHRDRNTSSFRFVVTFIPSWDTVFYSFSSSLSGWGSATLTPVNDHNATTTFGAVVDYCPDVGGGCVAYREYASDNVWFDGFSLTDVEEQTARLQPKVKSVEGGIFTNAHAEIYDVGGRLVATGSGSIHLRRGIYFVRTLGRTYKVMVK